LTPVSYNQILVVLLAWSSVKNAITLIAKDPGCWMLVNEIGYWLFYPETSPC
jgi:hypothetical protein